jgi:RNA polymerase primary sigma factor
VSFRFSEKIVEIRREYAKFNSVEGRDPTVDELSEVTGMDHDDIGFALLCIKSSLSLDGEIEEDGEELSEFVPDESTDVENDALDSAMLDKAKEIISHMPKTWQYVLGHRYCIDGAKEKSQRRIAEELGMTYQNIQLIEKKALYHLKKSLNSFNLL